MKEAEKMNGLNQTIVGIKGAGDIASGVAVRLKNAGFSRLFMLEVEWPLAVRRTVSFCEAIHNGLAVVEGIVGVLASSMRAVDDAWKRGEIPVILDPQWTFLSSLKPQVLVDAIMAKQNLGTHLADAPLVVGLGPGFTATKDVHKVVETHRGHDLGRVIHNGTAQANTGIPGEIGGHTEARVYRAPTKGTFHSDHRIADRIAAGDVIGGVAGMAVVAKIDGILRGLVRDGTFVQEGVKIGDIDPRACEAHCFSVSDKARAIGGGVLEAIMGANLTNGWQ